MELDPHEQEGSPRTVQIQNRRRKRGILQYQIIFIFNEKPKWVNFDDIGSTETEILKSIELYDKTHPFRKEKHSMPNRKIDEIVGLIKDGKEPKYVVKFAGSNILESVNSAYLIRFNKAMLLDFFESKIQFDYSKKTVSDPSQQLTNDELNLSTIISDENSKKDKAIPKQIFLENDSRITSPRKKSSRMKKKKDALLIEPQLENSYHQLLPVNSMIPSQFPPSSSITSQNLFYQQQSPYLIVSPQNQMADGTQYMFYSPYAHQPE